MATVTEVTLTCDVCGEDEDVKTWTFGLDGQAYEIDLCRKDGDRLGRITAGYIAEARKVIARPDHRRGQRHRSRLPRQGAAADRARLEKGVYVYGILPADIEMTADTPGVGERPGLLRVVRLGGLAALISEVDESRPLESADDLRIYREILDAIAVEVPVLPLRFGTVLASEGAVAEDLLAARREEFTAALEQLEGHAEFRVKGRYVNGAVTASRGQDTRALRQAMDGLSVASAVRELTHELDAVDIAFLVALNQEREVEQVIKDLASEWAGRIEVQLLGPIAAYDFAGTAQPDS